MYTQPFYIFTVHVRTEYDNLISTRGLYVHTVVLMSDWFHCLLRATKMYDRCIASFATVRDRHGYPLILFDTMHTLVVSSRSGHGQIRVREGESLPVIKLTVSLTSRDAQVSTGIFRKNIWPTSAAICAPDRSVIQRSSTQCNQAQQYPSTPTMNRHIAVRVRKKVMPLPLKMYW
jgi:hypothetical protein